MNAPFSKYLYIGFLLLGLYQGNDRPTWQKAVLIIHLALVAAMFGFGVGLNDK